MDGTVLPEQVSANRQGTFADFTITTRLPKIAEDIAPQVSSTTARRVRNLVAAVTGNSPIDGSHLAGRSSWWNEMAARVHATPWLERPFIEVEFLFYRAIDEIVGGVDVFYPQKLRAAQDLPVDFLDDLNRAFTLRNPIPPLLRQSVFANDHDLSQISADAATGYARDSERLLCDETEVWCSSLSATSGSSTIAIVLDNVGRELTVDLTLALSLLSRRLALRVDLHAKPMPMFVSDACRADIDEAIAALIDHGHPFARRVGEQSADALGNGSLRVLTPMDWGEGRSFDALSSELVAELQDHDALIFKGDLNYRRFFADRTWPWDTPVREATSGVPFRALALRALKSEVLVGIEKEVSRAASQQRQTWLTDGFFGIAQELGSPSQTVHGPI